jgi:uncharacterized membrane protein
MAIYYGTKKNEPKPKFTPGQLLKDKWKQKDQENEAKKQENIAKNIDLENEKLKTSSSSKASDAVAGLTLGLFQVFMPLIVVVILILFLVGPASFGILNVLSNTPIWFWLLGLFLVILYVKMRR